MRRHRCPLVRVKVVVLLLFLPHLSCLCMRVRARARAHVYVTSLYVYITPTPPTLPTFLFIGFVGKSSPSLLAHFHSRVLCPSVLPPCYILPSLSPPIAFLLFFLPNHRLHLSTIVVIALLLVLFSHFLRPLFLLFFLPFRFLSPRVISCLSPNTLTGISFSNAANCAR